MTSRSRPYAIVTALVGIALLSGVLRCWGLRWGLPTTDRFTTLYVDEYTPLWVLQQMHPGQKDFNPHYSHNPTFFYYQLGAALAAASKIGHISIAHDKTYYLQHPEDYAKLYVTGRALCVAYGMAATFLFFFIGKRVTTSDTGGLWTSFLYAVLPISVVQCHVIDTSVPASFWLGLSYWGLLQACSSKNKNWLYLGALAAGFSFSTKYTCAPIALLLAYTAWFIDHRAISVLAVLLVAGIAFVLGTPYMLLDSSHMLTGLLEMSQSAAGLNMAPALRTAWYPLAHYSYSVGLPASIVMMIGIMMRTRQRDPAVILSLLFLIPFLALLSRSALHVARYLNETLPFILPFCACPLIALVSTKKRSAIMAASVLACLCLSRIPYTLAIDRSLADEIDPRDRASIWMDTHVQTGAWIGLEQEANFMMPGHVYMDYWKGIRYPAESVRPPHYHFALWNRSTMAWDPRPPDYWIETNLFLTGVFKNTEQDERYASCVAAMRQGFHREITFERDVHWGPFRYELPSLAGNDWRILLPRLTIYARA